MPANLTSPDDEEEVLRVAIALENEKEEMEEKEEVVNEGLCSVKSELLKKVTDQNATRTDARWLSNQTQAIVFNRSEVHMVFNP